MSVTRHLLIGSLVSLAVVGTTGQASAQTFRGVQTCGGSECHTRSGEEEWLNSKPGGREHRASLARLRGSMDISQKYAKAVGLDDVFAPKGMCMKCHGAVPDATKIPEGVGCEGCHGAAGGYREFHQKTPKDYAGAVSRGMRDLKGKPTAWTRVCRDCHVLDKPEYEPLFEAGHKEGNRWRAKDKFLGVQAHWKRVTYEVGQVAAAEAGKPVTVTVAATPTPTEPPGKEADPVPAPVSTTKPALPRTAENVPPNTAGRGRSTGFSTGTSPPRAADPLPSPAAPPSMPQGVVSPLALPLPTPLSPSEMIAALQSRVAGFIVRLLESDARPAQPLKHLPMPQLAGPDAEFVQLQAEVLALAIDALNVPRPPPTPPVR